MDAKKYFNKTAKAWVEDAYNSKIYSIGHQRKKIVCKIFSKEPKMKIADLGCGAGYIALELAKRHEVVGIDQSKKMIEIAEYRKSLASPQVRKQVNFLYKPLQKAEGKFDAVIAIGVFYYLKKDLVFFKLVKKLLKPNGKLVVSARNRLFNMVSITERTLKEIKTKNAERLVKEIMQLYKGKVKGLKLEVEIHPKINTKSDAELRQHTPNDLKKIAKRHGFRFLNYYGVHPHLIAPPVFETKGLTEFESSPVSLAWSSQFIGEFKT